MNVMASSNVQLRLAKRGQFDAAAVAGVVNGAFYLHAFMMADRTSAEGVMEELGAGEFILAEDDAGLVGTALLKPSRDARSDELDVTVNEPYAMYIGLVCVAPRVTRTGIGRRLMADAERTAIAHGYSQVTLGTVREMGNVEYYQGLGYRVVGSQSFKAGHWGLAVDHEHCTMVKDLLVIREGQPDEAAAIAGIINRAYVVESFFKVGDRTDTEEVLGMMADHTFLVAESGGALIGSVRVAQQAAHAHFGMLAVEPGLKGNGLGRTLVGAAETWAIERGCDEMTLEVVNLRTELFPWYGRLGYANYATAPWPDSARERISQPVHFILMRKDLPSSTGSRER